MNTFSILTLLFIPQIMRNKSPNRCKYLPPHEDDLISTLQRRSYNRVIDQLNTENEYLSRNVHQLIVENMTLKNKIYHAWDNTYKTKQHGKNDVSEQMERLEGQSKSPYAGRRPQRSPLWKKVQQEQCKEAEYFKQHERQNSPGGSDFKRETIIEELSQSHFQSKNETPKAKEEKRGIFLSKRIDKPNTNKLGEKMVKSVEHLKRQDKLEERQKVDEKADEQIQREVSETKEMVMNGEQAKRDRKDNPQKETPQVSKQKTKHKYDNSPYLQVLSSESKTQSSYVYSITSPSISRKTYDYPSSAKRQRFSNKPYLNATFK